MWREIDWFAQSVEEIWNVLLSIIEENLKKKISIFIFE